MKTRSVLEGMGPYNPPRLREEISVDYGSDDFVKLTMNELSFGPLPEAREAIVETLARADVGARLPGALPDIHRPALDEGVDRLHGIVASDS